MIDSWTGEEFQGPAIFLGTSDGTETISRGTFFRVLGISDPAGIVPPIEPVTPDAAMEPANSEKETPGV